METKSVYVREQSRYSIADLEKLFNLDSDKFDRIISKLEKTKVLKRLSKNTSDRDYMELFVDEMDVSGADIDPTEVQYAFVYVGIIVIYDVVIMCYPKYMKSGAPSQAQMKQVIDVLNHKNKTGQNIDFYQGLEERNTYNPLPIILFLLYDYYECGIVSEDIEHIEINGIGNILWQKTIDESFAIIEDGRPYYTEVFDKQIIDDTDNYISRLHKLVITECSNILEKNELLDILGLEEVIISEDEWDNLGDRDYILGQIMRALSVEFNSHKQLILKTIYVYLTNYEIMKDENTVSLYGTSSFYNIWEQVCKDVLCDRLDCRLTDLPLDKKTYRQYKENTLLKEIIEKPRWYCKKEDKGIYAESTLIPDVIGIYEIDKESYFIIYDAKYYDLKLEEPNVLSGQPGIESITKQYLYQLAYNDFITFHCINHVKNCFIVPHEDNDRLVCFKGGVSMEIFEGLPITPALETIQVRKLSAEILFSLFLAGKSLDIKELQL